MCCICNACANWFIHDPSPTRMRSMQCMVLSSRHRKASSSSPNTWLWLLARAARLTSLRTNVCVWENVILMKLKFPQVLDLSQNHYQCQRSQPRYD
ncbi:hypothetical protein BC832DRAFT_544068 [Gaertneriomyces semiglobifer]|nr:hypothetical protein BC832DRAFT_544068 [Gaertneriomyces semiglobifer]